MPQLLIDHPIVELSTGLAVLQEVLAGRIVFQDRLVTLLALRAVASRNGTAVGLCRVQRLRGAAPRVSRLPWERCAATAVVARVLFWSPVPPVGGGSARSAPTA